MVEVSRLIGMGVPRSIEDGELLGTAEGVEPPDNHFNPKYWIGINLQTIDNELLQELVRNSFEIVKGKYSRKRK